MNYPQYRKYPNGLNYFKIISESEWEELQLIGSKVLLHHFVARILPDRNFLNDMLYRYEENWLVCTEQEYEKIRELVV